MQLRELIIAVFIFSGVMVGFGVFYSGLGTNYSTTQSKNLRTFNYTDDMYDSLSDVESKIEDIKTTGLGIDDIASWFVWGTYNAIRTMLTLPIALSYMLTDIAAELGLPAWVFSMAYGIILTIVIFGVAYVALKVKV